MAKTGTTRLPSLSPHRLSDDGASALPFLIGSVALHENPSTQLHNFDFFSDEYIPEEDRNEVFVSSSLSVSHGLSSFVFFSSGFRRRSSENSSSSSSRFLLLSTRVLLFFSHTT